MPSAPGLSLKLGQHWLIGGMTGVGKTFLATGIVQRLQAIWEVPAIYLDSKGGEFDHLLGREGVVHVEGQTPPEWPPAPGVNTIIWTPDRDDIRLYDAFLADIKASRRKCVVVVDELSSLGKESAKTFAPALPILLKQGRRLEITVVVLSQELAYVPRSVLRQTTHLALMMFDPADLHDFDTRRAQSLTGLPPILKKYEFNYRSRAEPLKRWKYRDAQQLLGVPRIRLPKGPKVGKAS